ncbi:hypothetical protein EDC39_10113 [Geothermobacter ehrlichii]|uniref:Uncharacterized protein n=1 Tax=Geothermobacter ehrlichii TaxID=213224 RepID=A0A5D3WNE5_9BACT|nr:hypothetical protein [Geothermobacter ehrlichii]TYO99853.1 hypothetical protein EDC39_10113 [Geothermobacter ehrlichii]
MEQAWLTHLLPEELPSPIDRLYFGAEFCCWRMPGIDSIRRAADLCRRLGIGLTLVTPVFYESWLPQAAALLEELPDILAENDELLFSDLGMAELARQRCPGLTLVCGRALSGQKRGPRVLGLDLTPVQIDYFRRGTWYSGPSRELLRELGVGRVELDNLLQGIAPLPAGLAGTLHLPYAMVTSSRNCPFREPRHGKPCRPVCGEVFTLKSAETPVLLYQGGNTQFLHNDRLPPEVERLGIDRIVRHLHLPA